MAEAAKAQEPSMEEILASIRRIIADDDTAPAAPRPAPEAAPAVAAVPPPAPPPEEPAPPPPEPEPAPSSEEVEWPAAAMEPEPAPEPAPEVLDLTEDMTALAEPPAFRTIDSEPDVVFADSAPEESAPEPEPEPEPQPLSGDRLLSGSATAAVDSAFQSLAQTVLLNNARTLEDLVREMLRPMLKTWLDDNLPGLVERLVRAEIDRVSRGRS
jgi:uncharacterized protein